MKFTRGHWFEISSWEFMLFDNYGQRVAHARPRVHGGTAILHTAICFCDCREEANFLEVIKVLHPHYAPKKRSKCLKRRSNSLLRDAPLPKWYPRKFRVFKKLKCHYLTAEDWKVCPITRGVGRSHNNYPNILGVARMYHIEPHKRKCLIPT